MVDRAVIDQLTRDLVDNGLLIEAGWVGLRASVIPESAPPIQVAEMRMAFFAGCQHLFGSIMSMLEAGDDPTSADLSRMDQIQAELGRFEADFRKQHGMPPAG